MTGQLSCSNQSAARRGPCSPAEGIRPALRGRRYRQALDPAGLDRTHFPAGENRTVITGARLKRMGLNRGFPDFQFFHRGGRVCFLELKRRGNALDENQAEIAAHLKDAGHDYVVTDNFEVAISALVEWRILRGMRVQ